MKSQHRIWAFVVASLAAVACGGSSGRAKPAEVEIFWPDAAVLEGAVLGAPEDAGATSSAVGPDAQPAEEPPK